MINEIHVETWGCFIKCVRIGENPPWYISKLPILGYPLLDGRQSAPV